MFVICSFFLISHRRIIFFSAFDIKGRINGFITLLLLLIVIINLDFILTSVPKHFTSIKRNINFPQRLLYAVKTHFL